jgi:serine/threonine protein phosphatase PrpC
VSGFETTAITVPYRSRCEDRVAVLDFEDGVILVVADGAGGTGAGDQAAETVIREITAAASMEHDQETWCGVLRQIDLRIGAGESTGVVVACSARGVVGASVGDSQAWFLADGELHDLTRNRVRKPLLGSGEAVPTGFAHPTIQGLLLVATDGFCNYVRRETLLKEILWTDFAVLARKLVQMVRLPSGELWDDVGLVVCRPRPRMRQRKRYNLTDAD